MRTYTTNANSPEEAVDMFHSDHVSKLILRRYGQFHIVVAYASGFVSVYFS